jgi:hypothetical protein
MGQIVVFSKHNGRTYKKILKWSDFHYSTSLNAWYVYIIDPNSERSFKHYISHQALNILGGKQDGDKLVYT